MLIFNYLFIKLKPTCRFLQAFSTKETSVDDFLEEFHQRNIFY